MNYDEWTNSFDSFKKIKDKKNWKFTCPCRSNKCSRFKWMALWYLILLHLMLRRVIQTFHSFGVLFKDAFQHSCAFSTLNTSSLHLQTHFTYVWAVFACIWSFSFFSISLPVQLHVCLAFFFSFFHVFFFIVPFHCFPNRIAPWVININIDIVDKLIVFGSNFHLPFSRRDS